MAGSGHRNTNLINEHKMNQYYYSDGNSKVGPTVLEKVVEHIIANPNGKNYVWKPGLEKWVTPNSIPEVHVALEAAQKRTIHQPPAVEEINVFDAEAQGHSQNKNEPESTDKTQSKQYDSKERYQGSSTNQTPNTHPYPKCDIGKRLVAGFIDRVIATVFFIPSVIILIVAFDSPFMFAPLLLVSILLMFAPVVYFLVKDGMGVGQSWGKQIMGLMVVELTTNQPCTKLKSAARNGLLLLMNAVIGVGWLVEVIFIFADKSGQRVGDHASSTMVIDTNEYTGSLL